MRYIRIRTDIVNCQVVIAHLAYVYQSALYELLHSANISFTHLGDESLWTIVSMVPHEGSLPPFVIVAIQDVEVSPCLKVRPAEVWMSSMEL